MKKIKQLLVVAGIFVFVGSFTAQAQTGNTLKDAAKKEQKKLDQEKDKVKDKTGKIKDDVSGQTDVEEDMMKMLEEKMGKANTESERQEVKKMIEQEMKKAEKDAGGKMDAAKSDASAKVSNAKKSASDKAGAISKDDGSVLSQNDGNGTASDKVTKATALGRAKRDDATAKLNQKEKDLEGKSELVKSGRARIASAKERLAAGIAGGELTEDQIAEKQRKIDRAEAGINKLEASINGGKAAYARQKASLSKLYDN